MTQQSVAPEMGLLFQSEPPADKVGPPPAEVLERLMKQRDEYVRRASRGRYVDAAGCEWRELPGRWRMAFLLIAGLGVDVADLDTLANREWLEMPAPERDELRYVARDGKKHMSRLVALAARV